MLCLVPSRQSTALPDPTWNQTSIREEWWPRSFICPEPSRAQGCRIPYWSMSGIRQAATYLPYPLELTSTEAATGLTVSLPMKGTPR